MIFKTSMGPRLWLGLALALINVSPAFAQKDTFDRESLKIKDSVVLKSGSKLLGDVQSQGVGDDGRKYVVFKTEDNGLLKLDLAKMVYRSKVREIDEIDKAYNSHISTLDDTADAHWELYNWCGNQPSGTVRFKDQQKFHLERIMELDPNDESAKRKLGYHYLRAQDRWVPEERYFQSLGYERKGTSWAPMKQREVDRKQEQLDSIEGERKTAFRVWSRARKSNTNMAALRAELFKICDAPAVLMIFEAAQKEKDPQFRALFVEAIGRVPSARALQALCVFSVGDDVPGIRERALALLAQDHYNQASAVAYLGQFLSSESNAYVVRAAFGIGELGDEHSTLSLVNALVTTHLVQPAGQAGRIQTGTGGDGNINNFSMGGDTKAVMRSRENPEVVAALRKVSGQDFGFDSAAWQRWYIKNHTYHDVKARR